MLKKYNNINFLIRFLIVEKVFKIMLSCNLWNNSKIFNTNVF